MKKLLWITAVSSTLAAGLLFIVLVLIENAYTQGFHDGIAHATDAADYRHLAEQRALLEELRTEQLDLGF